MLGFHKSEFSVSQHTFIFFTTITTVDMNEATKKRTYNVSSATSSSATVSKRTKYDNDDTIHAVAPFCGFCKNDDEGKSPSSVVTTTSTSTSDISPMQVIKEDTISGIRYQPKDTDSNLDALFCHLNNWIFHKPSTVSVNLFQAGRKKNYGFMNDQFTMLYLPTKPDNLANWLEAFNAGSSIKPAGIEEKGYAYYTWQSIVPLPRSKLTSQLRSKYKSNERRGFCDAPVVEDRLPIDLEKLFPKIAALAGLKKDKRVPKGWITFTKHGKQCTLTICKGNATEAKKSEAPKSKGLAFEGENQHEPAEEPLFQISGGIEISGLHDLFCVVEGLLRTL